jgi:phosphate transport system permease protein
VSDRTSEPGDALVTSGVPSLRRTFQRGEQWVWLAGSALAVAVILISGLLWVVLENGAPIFWAKPVVRTTVEGAGPLLGVVTDHAVLREGTSDPRNPVRLVPQTQFRVANRDVLGQDFVWHRDEKLGKMERPRDVVVLERTENGDFFGDLSAVKRGSEVVATGEEAWDALQRAIPEARRLRRATRELEKHAVGDVNHDIARARLAIKRAERELPPGPERDRRVAQQNAVLESRGKDYERIAAQIADLRRQARATTVVVRAAGGQEKELPVADVVQAHRPNQMSWGDKAALYARRLLGFVTDEPRESNQEGGVFPALFGTVMMTILMSLVTTPFGVLAALYLREYARQGPVVRLVRIAINNLAGVPSIVFGVFGLGFFVYFVGGGIDRAFYPEALPTPTWGTGGILWASLTLALLTVPVVIVATEEALAAVPRGAREASLALGASKFQTIQRIVLPGALPGILTGVILAMARGAGEVAPLMITGVVKLAPELPFDGRFPFLHLDRKFMHLGFHIYDVGFQSPNVEAAKPMVFMTTLLLIVIVVGLNVAAIRLRDRIRRKYQSSAFA